MDPSTRDSGGVAHKITAIGSRSTTSANAFLDKLRGLDGVNAWGSQNGVLDGAKGYGSYDEVYADSVSNSLPGRSDRQSTLLERRVWPGQRADHRTCTGHISDDPERRRRVRWHAAHLPPRRGQGGAERRQARPLREAIYL